MEKNLGKRGCEREGFRGIVEIMCIENICSCEESVLNYDFVIDGYKSSYTDMLDRFSEESMDFGEKQIAEYKESLSEFLNLFQVSYKQSSKIALLESFYVVYEKMGVRKTITNQVYNSILNSEQYISCARQGMVQMKSMNERWKTIYEIWDGAD